MTTCAMSGCRNEGLLLLHIRHRKDNLLQAEYCVGHFCEQMKEWNDDVEMANNVKNHYYFNGEYDYGYEKTDVLHALRFLWYLKENIGTPNATPDEVMEAFRMHQARAIKKIKTIAILGHGEAQRFLREHKIEWSQESKPEMST